eukprot:NODE_1645_length_564_cov_1.677670_g1328_i0.p3 GENE.NODE_1645_length_564_cov_1.677670_g1328_i0~~NODE_1645_length_564_cov_1.677670_g1328_i0.p3  ORF type:complete len:53 (+),score=2.40 NODE_1645_length_564_cov_1.677670_g1328_i0:253-411(+)
MCTHSLFLQKRLKECVHILLSEKNELRNVYTFSFPKKNELIKCVHIFFFGKK